MLRWLAALWKAQQRAIDARILWPSFREQARTIDDARGAFRMHMALDPAYNMMSEEERNEYLARLPE